MEENILLKKEERQDSASAKTLNPVYSLKEGQLLQDILEKSRKIVRLNFDLSQRLFENEKTIEDLSQGLEVLQKRIHLHQEESARISVLTKKIQDLVSVNVNLRKDLGILKQDLDSRERHINLLKREFGKKHPSSDVMGQKEQEISRLKEQISSLEKNMGLLQNDIKEKNAYAHILKRAAAKKQTIFLQKEMEEKERKINGFVSQISALNSKVSQLTSQLVQISSLKPEEIEALTSDYYSLKKIHPELETEIKMKEGINLKLQALLMEASKRIKALENKISSLNSENSNMRTELQHNGKVNLANKVLLKNVEKLKSSLDEKNEETKIMSRKIASQDENLSAMQKELEKLHSAVKLSAEANKRLLLEKNMLENNIQSQYKSEERVSRYHEVRLLELKEKILRIEKESAEKFKKTLSDIIKNKAFTLKENQNLKKTLCDLEKASKELSVKEDFYKRVILEMSKKELELKSEIEVLRNRNKGKPKEDMEEN